MKTDFKIAYDYYLDHFVPEKRDEFDEQSGIDQEELDSIMQSFPGLTPRQRIILRLIIELDFWIPWNKYIELGDNS